MTQDPPDPRQLAALQALRPDRVAAHLVIYSDGTLCVAVEHGQADRIAARSHGIRVGLLPDPADLPAASESRT